MSAMTKDDLHRLVDELPASEVATAGRVLAALRLLPPPEGSPPAEDAAESAWDRAMREGRLVPYSVFASQPRKTLEELAREQGVKPITDPDTLRGDFWPEDETADEFIAAIRELRREGGHA